MIDIKLHPVVLHLYRPVAKVVFWSSLFLLCTQGQVRSQDLDGIGDLMDSVYARERFSANIIISKNGKKIFERSYGYADHETKQSLTSSHAFQIASISKQFTAYGILLLHNKGALHYDSAVIKYLPRFPYPNISIRHLISHTSGLPDFWNQIRPHLDTTRSNGNKDMLSFIIDNKMPLRSDPGLRYAYSDIGYDILAMIIENVSGERFDRYMEKNIFQPLKMKDTRAHMVTDIRRIAHQKLATGYELDAASGNFMQAHLLKKNNFVFYLGDFYGDGSVVSTAADLLLWSNALKDCILLPCGVQEVIDTPFTSNGTLPLNRNGSEVRYGFGWFIDPGNVMGNTAHHSGGHPGYVNFMFRYLEKDITLIMLSNAVTPSYRSMIPRIHAMLTKP